MSLKDHIRVMVVDDMSVSRGLLQQALDKMGVRNTDFCNSGDEAYRKLVANPVHLVISDYNMPGMDGLTLLKQLRENKSTQKIGFILVTGSEDGNLYAKGRALGLNNFLKKPFTPESMQACIERVTGPL